MEVSYNLIDQPFLPLVDLQGKPCLVGIRQTLLEAQHFNRISASFPQTNAAIYRVLLAILHRVFGPKDVDEWQMLWQHKHFDPQPVEQYLSQWHERFDLFAPDHPFFQNRHPDVELKPANALLFLTSGGDADTLFEHSLETDNKALSPGDAALALLTAQSFSLAGLCHPQKKLNYTDAPCGRAVSFFLQGSNLFESLMLNLVRHKKNTPIPWNSSHPDQPCWEKVYNWCKS